MPGPTVGETVSTAMVLLLHGRVIVTVVTPLGAPARLEARGWFGALELCKLLGAEEVTEPTGM